MFAVLLAAAAPAERPAGDPGTASGAGTLGTLDGRLTDTHSVPLAQAEVVVRNLATGTTARGVTGKNGSYHFSGLGPGEYRLEARVPELGRGAVEGILISAGHATRVQAALVMELPPPAAIESDLRGLDPVSPAVTTLIDAEGLASIPVRGRDWQAFAATTPATAPAQVESHSPDGWIAEAAPDASLDFSGMDGELAAKEIDGIATVPAFHSQSGQPRQAGHELGTSAVESFRVRTGDAAAEGGPGIAAGMTLTTTRGHNGLHGQGFYLNRESLWGAQNPFTQWIQETAPVNGTNIAAFSPMLYTPANSRQTFGLGMGSQIRHNKLFWFGAVDGLLRSDPAVATVRHPDNFFAPPTNDELTLLAARLDLPGPAILENGAAAYSSGLEGLAGLLGPVRRRSNQWQGFARLDWHINERQHLNVEAGAAREDAAAGALSATSETYGSHSFGNSQARDLWELGQWESFLTANLLNSLGIQFHHHVQGDTPQTPSALEAPLLANGIGQLPEMIADSKYGFVLGKPARLGGSKYPDENLFTAQETLSWVRGPHLFKAGTSFDHAADAVNTIVNQTGTYSYVDVLNFVTDVASFEKYGVGATSPGSFGPQANCNVSGKLGSIQNRAPELGTIPCYAWFSQRVGPANWHVSTNLLAAFVTEQWQPAHNLTLSAGVRVEMQQLPPPLKAVENPVLPQTETLPSTGMLWGPRVGIAWEPWSGTVVRAGGGLYYGRIDNAVLLAALTQTGSLNGDLNLFFRPTDTGAPPFPTIFPGVPQTVVTPGAVAFAPHFRPQQVDQAVMSLEQRLPSHWLVNVSAMTSLGRRLPISIDTNLQRALNVDGKPQTIVYDVEDSIGAGPIKTPTLTVPLYNLRPNLNLPSGVEYQQTASIESRANSTYDAAMVRLVRYGGHGQSLHAHYMYAHATDWNPNESAQVAGSDVLDPANFRLEYGTSNLDIRHSAGMTLLYRAPWKLQSWEGWLANGWGIAAVGKYHSGLPFTVRTSGYIPGFYDSGTLIQGVATGINGSGGDNRLYEIGRNTYRYPATYDGDARVSRRFNLAHNRQLELLAESFNLFNHQNVTLIETTGYYIDRGSTSGGPATLNFMTGLTKTGLPSPTLVEFGKPLNINATDFFRPREIELGLKARF